MTFKYAVALMKGDNETILGIFDTKAQADEYGRKNRIPHAAGLQYCFKAPYANGQLQRDNLGIYDYYNVNA